MVVRVSPPNELEERWKESERQYQGDLQEARRRQWVSHFRRLAANHRGIAEHFEDKASALHPGEGGS